MIKKWEWRKPLPFLFFWPEPIQNALRLLDDLPHLLRGRLLWFAVDAVHKIGVGLVKHPMQPDFPKRLLSLLVIVPLYQLFHKIAQLPGPEHAVHQGIGVSIAPEKQVEKVLLVQPRDLKTCVKKSANSSLRRVSISIPAKVAMGSSAISFSFMPDKLERN